MRRRLLSAFLGICFSGLFAASAARASYIDFRALASTYAWDNQLVTVVDGVTITATPVAGNNLLIDPVLGAYGFATSGGSPDGSYPFAFQFGDGAFSTSFSSPVSIISVDLFDFYNSSYNTCAGDCPAPANDTLGTYSVNGGASAPLVTPPGQSYQESTTGYSSVYGGYAFSGDPLSHIATQAVGQTGTEIVFQPKTISFGAGVDYGEHFTYFGVWGITFETAATPTMVPELAGSAAISALALLVGALALAGERRRRRAAL